MDNITIFTCVGQDRLINGYPVYRLCRLSETRIYLLTFIYKNLSMFVKILISYKFNKHTFITSQQYCKS